LPLDLACQRMSAEQIGDLEKAQQTFADALQSNDMIKIAQTDEAYHDVIYAKGPAMTSWSRSSTIIREQMYRYRLEYIKDTGKRKQLLSSNMRKFWKRSRQGNIPRAKAAMREHIDNQEITVSRN
jgi:DNA-binding GntR family transcriptional regulator